MFVLALISSMFLPFETNLPLKVKFALKIREGMWKMWESIFRKIIYAPAAYI